MPQTICTESGHRSNVRGDTTMPRFWSSSSEMRFRGNLGGSFEMISSKEDGRLDCGRTCAGIGAHRGWSAKDARQRRGPVRWRWMRNPSDSPHRNDCTAKSAAQGAAKRKFGEGRGLWPLRRLKWPQATEAAASPRKPAAAPRDTLSGAFAPSVLSMSCPISRSGTESEIIYSKDGSGGRI